MNKAVILTQAMIIDGHTVRMTYAPEDNPEALQDVKDILLGTLENPHNLQLFTEGGVADERTV